MAKLYSVKEIAELLNKELAEGGISYRYTEERVRSRLRYLRSKATDEARALHVTPKVLGHDRRAKYYTEEDVQRLRSIWVGPMLPEFETYLDDTGSTGAEDEVEIRDATAQDIARLLQISGVPDEIRPMLEEHLSTMLEITSNSLFVAVRHDDDIVGWSQAEISAATSTMVGSLTGVIRALVSPTQSDLLVIARSLIFRAEWWLKAREVQRILVELPTSLPAIATLKTTIGLQLETEVVLMQAE